VARPTTSTAVNLDDVVPVLIARKKAEPKVRVLIRSDALTPVRYVSAVVEASAKAGISDVTFATLSR
jgi:biopolymer transport protein ExbD